MEGKTTQEKLNEMLNVWSNEQRINALLNAFPQLTKQELQEHNMAFHFLNMIKSE
jgi:hypothetical protein